MTINFGTILKLFTCQIYQKLLNHKKSVDMSDTQKKCSTELLNISGNGQISSRPFACWWQAKNKLLYEGTQVREWFQISEVKTRALVNVVRDLYSFMLDICPFSSVINPALYYS